MRKLLATLMTTVAMSMSAQMLPYQNPQLTAEQRADDLLGRLTLDEKVKLMGCGLQKGANEFYRGIPVEINLLPKIRVDIVVSKVPVERVIDAARKALYTGHIGDGKIFVLDVENVVKVRTGESGYDALQGDDER